MGFARPGPGTSGRKMSGHAPLGLHACIWSWLAQVGQRSLFLAQQNGKGRVSNPRAMRQMQMIHGSGEVRRHGVEPQARMLNVCPLLSRKPGSAATAVFLVLQSLGGSQPSP